MTASTDPVMRALTDSDAHLFHTLPDPGLVGRTLVGRSWSTREQGGEYRPEWAWVALRDGKVVARAAWWGAPDDETPQALDWFDFADGEAATATRLLGAAPLHAEYDLLVPPGWRDVPAVRAAAQARIDAAEAAGMKVLVERFRYEWSAGLGLPDRPGRLEFRPEPDDGIVLDVLRRIGHGSLDAHTRQAVREHGEEAAAQEEFDLLARLPSPRSWWRLAHTPDGRLVGVQVPALNTAGACVGFIGVLPEHRGNGFAYDLLAECTHQLAAEGATHIAAATDQHNFPMAAAFTRAGYPVVQERINLV